MKTQMIDARLDSNETVFFLRELEHRDPVKYQNLFAALKGRRFIPLIEGIPEHATSYRYKMYEVFGDAKIMSPDSTELPIVGVRAREVQRNIKSIGCRFEWTIDEIKASAATGAGLDDFTVMAAMSTAERQTDTLLAVGDSSMGIEGLLNHTGVAASTASTKTGGGTAWTGASVLAEEIIGDVNRMLSETRAALKQAAERGGLDAPAFERWVLLLPGVDYTKIATTPRSSTSDKSILSWMLENNPFLESIEEWSQCDSVSSATRAFLYPRDPLCVGGIVNQEFTQHAPQPEDLKIKVPCQMKCGGTVIRYPVACRYMASI
jgi:hypothetical protein